MRLLATFVLLTATAFAQAPSPVIQDPPQQSDRKFAARMVELHVPAVDSFAKPTGELMNGIMYVAAGAGPHPTVILLHGFPGNEQNLDLAQSIRREGWNVLYFHYRGSWGSQGDFSFANAQIDTCAAIRFLHDPNNVKQYGIDTKRIVLVGHSMGGFMAARAAYALSLAAAHGVIIDTIGVKADLAGVVLISPWNLGRNGAALADNPDNQRLIAETTAEWHGYQLALHGFIAEDGIAAARAHTKDWDLLNQVQAITQHKLPVLLTYGQFEDAREEGFALLNDRFRSEEAKAGAPTNTFMTVVLPTDHAYSDQRIALQSAIVNWLQRFAPKATQ